MTRTVCHIGDVSIVRPAVRTKLVKRSTNALYDLQVRALILSTDIVGFTWQSVLQDQIERFSVILDIKPVANIGTVPVNRQRLPFECVQNHQRNELLRELIRAIVIGAVGDDNWQTVRPMPCNRQMVGCRFGGRIRRGGIIGCGLSEKASCSQRTIDLVGRNMQESEIAFCRPGQAGPIATRRLKQRVGANDVCIYKAARARNRTIYVALSGEMQNCVRREFLKQVSNARLVADIRLRKTIPRIALTLRSESRFPA
jgi:hypothetical protein